MFLKEAIFLYKSDNQFLKLSPASQTQYSYYLELIEKKFHRNLIINFSEREHLLKVRAWIKTFVLDTPRKARYILAVFKILINWCYCEGYVRHNRLDLLKIDIVYSQNLNNGWDDKDIEFVLKNATKPLYDFIFVALQTGLRSVDLMKLTYNNITIDASGYKIIVLKQSKTQKTIFIPVNDNLNEWLEQKTRHNDFLLNSFDKTPWTKDKLQTAFKRLRKRLNLNNLTFAAKGAV